jgi:hypothetical protein
MQEVFRELVEMALIGRVLTREEAFNNQQQQDSLVIDQLLY